jgi:hypothetical protein
MPLAKVFPAGISEYEPPSTPGRRIEMIRKLPDDVSATQSEPLINRMTDGL